MQDPQQPSTPSKKKDDTPAEPDVTQSDAAARDKPTAYSDEVGKPVESPAEPTKDAPAPEEPAVPDADEKLLPAQASEDEPREEPQEEPSVLADTTSQEAEAATDTKPEALDTELPSLEAEEPAIIPDESPASTAAATPAPSVDNAKPAPSQNDSKPVSISVNSPKPESAKPAAPAAAPEQTPVQMAQNAFQPDNPSGVVGVAGGMVSTKPKKSRAKKVALVLALLILLGGGAGAYYWWTKHKETDKKVTQNNSNVINTTTDDTCSQPVKAGGTAYSQTGGTVSKENQAYTASAKDVSAVKVASSGALTLTNPTIVKSGDTSSSDNSSFTGQNAGVLATDSSKITITCGTINTTGAGANGVFAYGSGSSVTLANLVIKASGQYAHGAMASGGGALTLSNVILGTTGANSAPIATDRGGGTVTVEGGTATSTGADSPGIYSTGTITVANATIAATGSEAAVVEGSNKTAPTVHQLQRIEAAVL